MKKVRCYLSAIALVLALSGPVILGIGAGSLANVASSRHVSAAAVAGQSTSSVAYHPLGWCPIVGIAC